MGNSPPCRARSLQASPDAKPTAVRGDEDGHDAVEHEAGEPGVDEDPGDREAERQDEAIPHDNLGCKRSRRRGPACTARIRAEEPTGADAPAAGDGRTGPSLIKVPVREHIY